MNKRVPSVTKSLCYWVTQSNRKTASNSGSSNSLHNYGTRPHHITSCAAFNRDIAPSIFFNILHKNVTWNSIVHVIYWVLSIDKQLLFHIFYKMKSFKNIFQPDTHCRIEICISVILTSSLSVFYIVVYVALDSM